MVCGSPRKDFIMFETRYKILVYKGVPVCLEELADDYYPESNPILFYKNTSMDDLIGRFINAKNIHGHGKYSENFIEQLKKCDLVDVYLSVEPKGLE